MVPPPIICAWPGTACPARYWQATATFPSGGIMLCGLTAPDSDGARSAFREVMAWTPSKAFPALTVVPVPPGSVPFP